jgi:glycosyltransferase involved in cell wall biosynthesis
MHIKINKNEECKMNILLVVAYFYPEIGSASNLFYDLAKAFLKRGHNVNVLTSYPRKYNIQIENRKNKYPKFEIYDGLKIHRVSKIEFPRDILITRGLEHILLPLFYLTKINDLKNIDLIIIYSPPLPLFIFGKFLKKLKGIPFILNNGNGGE